MSYAIVADMAEPVGGRLSAAFRQTYEQAGVSQLDVATTLGVDQPTVSRWARGARRPPLDALPPVEQLCQVPKGTILRAAGYVDPDLSVLAAIDVDPLLDDHGRAAMRATYRALTNRDVVAELRALRDELAERQRN
jgi:transcriptional regulator with XRE-family HTH domain